MRKSFLKTSVGLLTLAAVVATGAATFVRAATNDTAAPTAAITAPVNGATVTGTTIINANAADTYSNCVVTLFGKQYDVSPLQSGHSGGNIFTCGTDMTAVYQGMHGTNVSRMQQYEIPTSYTGVTKVEFYVDGSLKNTDTTAPYSFSWDTTTVANGSHALMAKSYDAANHTGSSTTVNVTVQNAVVADTTAPSVPQSLSASAVSSSQINLSWTASTDNVGVTGYHVFRNNVAIATTTSTTYADTGLTASTTYSYMVNAFDAAGNTSANSNTAAATTLPTSAADTTPPVISLTIPTTTASTTGTVTLGAVATDNVGVTKVEFYVDGALKSTDTTAPYTFTWNTTKITNGQHSVHAKAYDAAGNVGTTATITFVVTNPGSTLCTIKHDNGKHKGWFKNGKYEIKCKKLKDKKHDEREDRRESEKKQLELQFEAEKKQLELKYKAQIKAANKQKAEDRNDD